MRILRLALAVLLAASLAASPAAAGMAMTKAANAEMAMGASGDHCPCCDASKKCLTENCMLQCYNVPALALEVPWAAQPLRHGFARLGVVTPSPYQPRPDPPPPRS